jgi:hypothetical protein
MLTVDVDMRLQGQPTIALSEFFAFLPNPLLSQFDMLQSPLRKGVEMTEHNVGKGLLININTLTFHYLFTTFQSFTTFLTQLLLTIHQTVHLY